MAQISQVQISFNAAEDRLLMRLATDSSEEFRCWLTRRFVKALRPHLAKSLAEQPRIRTQANPEARRELLKFEQQQAVGASDFKTPYQAADRSLPLGETPMLLTRFQIRPQANGAITLAIGQEQGPGIDLALNSQLLHSIAALMDAAISKAAWDLAPTEATPDTRADAGPRNVLN